MLYTDNSILTGPDESEIDQVISDLRREGLKLTVKGDMGDFLGVRIDQKMVNGKEEIHLTQPHLIDQILRQRYDITTS